MLRSTRSQSPVVALPVEAGVLPPEGEPSSLVATPPSDPVEASVEAVPREEELAPANQMSPLVPLLYFALGLLGLIVYGALSN